MSYHKSIRTCFRTLTTRCWCFCRKTKAVWAKCWKICPRTVSKIWPKRCRWNPVSWRCRVLRAVTSPIWKRCCKKYVVIIIIIKNDYWHVIAVRTAVGLMECICITRFANCSSQLYISLIYDCFRIISYGVHHTLFKNYWLFVLNRCIYYRTSNLFYAQ